MSELAAVSVKAKCHSEWREQAYREPACQS